MQTHTQAHPFRDGSAGSEAKRRELLSKRRADLANMNHEIRRVFVARLAGLSAALALCLGGSLLLLSGTSTALAASLASYMPGQAPAPLSTLLLATWLLAALAFLGGRAMAEHRFNLAMSRAVLPTSDLHVDLARLSNEAPDSVGRRLARRLETRSRMSLVLAAGLVLPASLLVLWKFVAAGAYPRVDLLENSLSLYSGTFIEIALLALGNALCIGLRPNSRAHSILALNLGACVALALFSPNTLYHLLPAALFLTALGAAKAAAHRRENVRIDQEGAPLPPVFNYRQRLHRAAAALKALPTLFTRQKLRAGLDALRGKLHAARTYRPSVALLVSLTMILAGAGAMSYTLWPSPNARAAGESQTATIEDPGLPAQPQSFATRRDDGEDGALIDLHFADGQKIDAAYLLGDATIPVGWRASITLTRLSGDGPFFVQALPDNAYQAPPRQLSESSPTVTLEQTNCGPFEMPLLLDASAYGSWADKGSARLRYQVRLELAGDCGLAD